MGVIARIPVPAKTGDQMIPKFGAAYGDVVFGTIGDNNVVTIQTGAALTFFKEYAMRRPRLVANAIGLYSHGSIGRLGKVKWNIIGAPKHVWQPRSESCSWNPKGKFPIYGDTIVAHGIELNLEMCDKDLLDQCTRQLFGVGTEINNLMATPEGEALFNMFLSSIYEGKGNSLYDLLTYGDHPYIWQAQTNGTFGIPSSEATDYVDQMQVLGGHITLIDYEKSIGRKEYNVAIAANEISGGEFIGDAQDLFRRVDNSVPVRMNTVLSNSRAMGKPGIYLVSPSIFNKYERELTVTNTLNGSQVIMEGIYPTAGTVQGLLKFKGDYVLRMDDWAEFDQIVGVHTHRVVKLVPGALGIAYDIPALEQFGDDQSGLVVEKSTSVKDKFKTYVYGEMEVGAGLVSKDYVVNASISVPIK